MTALQNLSAQERMILVHAAYGRAMLYAHSLEKRLSSLLICQVVATSQSKWEQDEAIAEIERLPLGILIKRFVTEYSPTETLRDELDNMLFFRNELAHRISAAVLSAAFKTDWEESVIEEMHQITEYFLETIALLKPYSQEWLSKFGWTNEELLEIGYAVYPGAKARSELGRQ